MATKKTPTTDGAPLSAAARAHALGLDVDRVARTVQILERYAEDRLHGDVSHLTSGLSLVAAELDRLADALQALGALDDPPATPPLTVVRESDPR